MHPGAPKRPAEMDFRELRTYIEDLKKINPKIVFMTISGYGMTGPYKDLPSHGIAYDTCHFALQYEEAHEAIARLNAGGAPVLKFHLSSALKLKPTEVALARLAKMHEPTYLHQTMGRAKDGSIVRFKDIPLAMAAIDQLRALEELRVHFHVPVNADRLSDELSTTNDHLRAALDVIAKAPGACRELEIETYTWEVLPPEVRAADVADMIAEEYRWTLAELAQRGVKPL